MKRSERDPPGVDMKKASILADATLVQCVEFLPHSLPWLDAFGKLISFLSLSTGSAPLLRMKITSSTCTECPLGPMNSVP